jgi:hypothetical protein
VVRLLPVLVLAACASSELAQPIIRARMGPAAERPLHKVVALSASCGALSTERVPGSDPDHPVFQTRTLCPQPAMQAIDTLVRSTLEFGGYQIIDAEKVNAVTATRHEVEQRNAYYTTRTAETHGARFEDATPFEQAAILKELGAEAVLTTRIWIGAGVGFGERRTVAAQIRLMAVPDGGLAWVRRCEIEVGGLTFDEDAMERAARCAIQGAKAR